MYTHLELHLAALPLSRKHAKAVMTARGERSTIRGYRSARYVTLPATERELIDELVRTYPCPSGHNPRHGTAIVARGGDSAEPAWVVVQYVVPSDQMGASEQFERLYTKALAQAVSRGICRSDAQRAWDAAFSEATTENDRRNRAVYLDVMTMALIGFLKRTDIADEQRWCAERYLRQYKEGRVL